MIKTRLKIFRDELGSVMHGIRHSDVGYEKFGEVYFSTVNKESIKAWKLHKKMTLNLLVPVGEVLFGFYDLRKQSSTFKKTYKLALSHSHYERLTVPPGIWFGFKGIDRNVNLVCNVASIAHDKTEVLRKNLNEIKFDWRE